MLELRRLVLGAGLLMLTACASAVFPDFDDNEEDVVVSEGGRVVRQMPEEGSSLRADTQNAAYEGEEDAEEAEMRDEPQEDDVEEIVEEETVTAAETVPVKEENLEEPQEEDVEAAEVVEELTSEPAGPSVSYRVDTFYFDNGSAYLSPKYNPNLRKIAKMVKENNANVVVYGHSSSRTRDTDPVSHKLANFKASLERAQNVAAALRRAGVPSGKISIQAMSDSAPAYQEVMPEGERLNRRAEVYISY